MPLFQELTGREEAPDRPATEAWIIAGRRSAKSRKAATIAVYLATIGAEVLGYRGSAWRRASAAWSWCWRWTRRRLRALDYAKALFDEIPMFRRWSSASTAEGLDLNNSMSLMVVANDFRSIRGRTLVAAIFDEVCVLAQRADEPTLTSRSYRAVKPALGVGCRGVC